MKVPDTLILVSRSSIRSKVFGVSEETVREKFSGPDLEKALAELPTTEEEQFMEIYNSTIPELARLQRKMSVCLDAEVIALSDESVAYKYGGRVFKIDEPKNAYRICMALEKNSIDATAEMCSQGCVSVDAVALPDMRKQGSLKADEMKLLVRIAEKFFFQTYME